MSARRVDFMGCPLDPLTMEETLVEVERLIADGRPHQHVVINAAKVVAMAGDAELHRTVSGCALINADGQSVVWAARLLGHRVPERVAGIDLMQALVERAHERRWRLYFLGAEESVVRRVVAHYEERYPGLQVAGWQHGYFSATEEPEVVERIRQSGADILFVAFGSPRKEQFIKRWLEELDVPFCMGVGGSFDVVAGKVSRAPRWMQRAGLEWAHRLLKEPRRLWRRYWETNSRFLLMVAQARLFGRRIQPGRNRRPVLLVEDGTHGGIQRAVDYLAAGLEETPQAPPVERLALRGGGSLVASGPVFLGALAPLGLGLLTRRWSVVHVNMTQRGSTARALPVVALAGASRTPVLLHLHSSQYQAFTSSLPTPALAVVRWMFRSVDRVVVLGDMWRDYVASDLRVPLSRIAVMRNAVPGPAEVAREASSTERVRVLFLGQLGPRKGAPDLIAALARPRTASLPWEVTMAGDGDVEAYRAQAQACGLDGRVRFTGWVDQPEVRRLLAESDAMVLPSYAEGLPLSVLEGLAHGLAVISTPVGAIGEVIRDGETGLLVPPGDVPALAGAIERVVCDDALRVRLATNGRRQWEREHAIPVYAERMVALYDALCDEVAAER